jgi:hypothetical protein
VTEQLFSAISIKYPAAVDLTQWQAVVAIGGQARPADPTNPAHQGVVRGLAMANYLSGETATILLEGPALHNPWTWTPGARLYVGGGGALTETPPPTGWIQPIAVADTSARIFVRVDSLDPRYASHDHRQEQFTLGALDIANKFLLLALEPATSGQVALWVRGSGYQPNGSAFVMDGTNPKKVRWDGLSLDGLLQAGDVVVMSYYRE